MTEAAFNELNATVQESIEYIRGMDFKDESTTHAIDDTCKLAKLGHEETKLAIEEARVENESRRIDLEERKFAYEVAGGSNWSKVKAVADIVSPIAAGGLYLTTFFLGLGFEQNGVIGNKLVQNSVTKALGVLDKLK